MSYEYTPGQMDLGSTLAYLPKPKVGPYVYWTDLVRRFEGVPDIVLHTVAAEIDDYCKPPPASLFAMDPPVKPQPSAATIERMVRVASGALIELDEFLAARRAKPTTKMQRRR